jgi:ATP-dependent protease ClpP protease subunit/proteasome lid subunit RPN8/RPN11
MKNPLARFEARAASGILTLYIYDAIGASLEGITAKQVTDKLQGDYKSITMRINSPGGNPFEAITILNALKSVGKPITVIVDGMAASAASLLAMVGDTIKMGQGSMMMVHNAMSQAFGNAASMREMADTLEKVSNNMAGIYATRTGLDTKKVKTLMDAETWMTAQVAVDNGFATELLADENQEAVAAAASFDLSHFKNAPVAFDKNQPRDKNGKWAGGGSGSNGHVDLGHSTVSKSMGDMYGKAETTFNFKQKKEEFSFTVNKDGSVTAITSSGEELKNHLTITKGETVAVVHTHPLGAKPEPSPNDIEIAKAEHMPNYVLSKGDLWVANPDGTTEHVATVSYRNKAITVNYTEDYMKAHPSVKSAVRLNIARARLALL